MPVGICCAHILLGLKDDVDKYLILGVHLQYEGAWFNSTY